MRGILKLMNIVQNLMNYNIREENERYSIYLHFSSGQLREFYGFNWLKEVNRDTPLAGLSQAVGGKR